MRKLLKNLTVVVFFFLISAFCLTACKPDDVGSTDVTVNFVDGSGNVLYVDTVQSGGVPAYEGEMPTQSQSRAETFIFAGWSLGGSVYSGELPKVTENTTFTAAFTSTLRTYEITFLVGEDEYVQSVEYGQTPAFSGEIQFIDGDDYCEIVGWDSALSPVEGDKKYQAIIERTRGAKAEFYDEDGTLLYTDAIVVGEVPVYGGDALVKESTVSETFTFVGWRSGETVYTTLPAVTENTSFTAVYESSVREYEITFTVDGDQTVISVPYGQTPSYTGEEQFVKDGINYYIKSWNKAFTPATENTEYVAVVRPSDTVTVTFVVNGESITETVVRDQIPKFYGTPYQSGNSVCTYSFAGWTDGVQTYTTLPAATVNVTYTAVFAEIYKEYSVSFYNGNDLISEQTFLYGETPVYVGNAPTQEESERVSYVFKGWKADGKKYYGDLPAVTENINYYAFFEETPRSLAITVEYKADGSVIDTKSYSYIYGDSYQIQTPVKSGYTPDVPYLSGTVTESETFVVTYSPSAVWAGDSVAFTGGGTQDDPYLIQSGANLAYLAASVDGGTKYSGNYFRMTQNIDLAGLAWNAIGTNSKVFAGTFDGNGFTISGLMYDNTGADSVTENRGNGLFSTINGATIQNLSVSGFVRSVARYTGMLVGNCSGNSVIDNCKTYGEVYGYGNVGGIVGIMKGTISNCENYAHVGDNGNTSAYRIGGIAGLLNADGSSATNCINYGSVYVAVGSGQNGGIIGRMENSVTLNNCENRGYVYSNTDSVGGIVGYYAQGTNLEYQGLKNYAPVEGKAWVGGIAGTICGVDLKYCENHGAVKGTSRVGGLVGRMGEGSKSTVCGFDQCANYGRITAAGTYCGGIAGVAYDVTENCVNYGKIINTGTSTGGIIGALSVNASAETPYTPIVRNCANYGEMSTKASGNTVAGGIVGRTDRSVIGSTVYNPLVQNCQNYADVTLMGGFAGGIIGACNGGIIDGCINYGAVLAQTGTYVGGIAGSNYGYGTVKGCDNYGAVYGGATFGQICGQLTNTSTATSNRSLGKLL